MFVLQKMMIDAQPDFLLMIQNRGEYNSNSVGQHIIKGPNQI